MQNRVTLQDIAIHCGVSKGAVSRALHGYSNIGPATTKRITDAAAELGYNPALNETARRLALMRRHERIINRVIGIFFSPHFYAGRNNFHNLMFQGIMDVLMEEGYGALTNYYQIGGNTPCLLPVFERGDVDGAIIYGQASTQALAQVDCLRHTAGFADRPIVSLLKTISGCSVVNWDGYEANYLAVQHLLELGHRQIIRCNYEPIAPDTISLPDRHAGACQAITDFGLDPAAHLHMFNLPSRLTNPMFIPTGNRVTSPVVMDDENCQRLLDTLHAHPDVTAIVAMNDANAFYIWQVLHHAGIRVPDDISLVGFDDTDPVLNSHAENLLTTVRMPLYEIGQKAARLIIGQITEKEPLNQKTILPTEFIERASTRRITV